MTKAVQPRRASVDGQEFILLTPQEHDQLEAARRQTGAATARSSRLRGELAACLALVAEIGEQVEASLCTCRAYEQCLRCVLTGLLARRDRGAGSGDR